MKTSGDEHAFDPHDRLAQQKIIDSICDRFEAAWDAGKRPRIEAYLADAENVDPVELFRELLASELALRGRIDPAACDIYLERFPQFRECICAAFAKMIPTPPAATGEGETDDADSREFRPPTGGAIGSRASAETGPLAARPPLTPVGEPRRELIVAARKRLALAQNRTIDDAASRTTDRTVHGMEGVDRAPSTTAGQPPLSADESRAIEQLWDSLVRTASVAEANPPLGSGPENRVTLLCEVAARLLDAFPSFRRQILLSLLIGESCDQTADRHQCSQRTVVATCRLAIDLLARSVTQ